MNQFKITLVKQSKKPDPKTGRKKRTKQPLSRPKKINFNIKIHKDEKENENMKINMPSAHRENPYEFKIKIHKGDETIENLTDDVVNTEDDKFHFNTRILKSVETEKSDLTVNHDPVMTTVQINKPFESESDSNEPISNEETEEEFDIEEEELEEIKIPSDEEIQSEEEDEDFEDENEEDNYEAEEETEELESEEEVSNELEEAGIDESVFDTITVNGEVMNAVELNSEEEEEEFDDEVPPYEEEEDYSYEDLIPSKYNRKNASKKGKKKSIENEF